MPEKGNNGIEESVPTVDNTVSEQSPIVDNVQPTEYSVNDFGLPSGDDFTGNGKRKKKLIPIIAIIAVVLAAIGGGVFFYFNSKPKAVMESAINDAYKKEYGDLSKFFKDLEENSLDYDIFNDTLKVSGEVSVGGELLKGLENNTIKFDLGIDVKNEMFEGTAILTEKNKDLIDATVFGKNGKLYMKSNSLLNGVYYIDDFDFEDVLDLSELEDMMNQVNLPKAKEIDKIVESIKNAVIESLDEDEMEKSKDEIKINNEKINATKITYTIDEKSTEKFVKSMLKQLKKDDDLLESIANIANIDVSELESALEEAEDSIDGSFEGMGKGKLNVYTTGVSNDFAMIELVTDSVKISYGSHKDNGCFVIKAESDDEEIKFEILSETKKDITTVEVNYNDDTLATFTVRAFNSNYLDLDYDINIPEEIAGDEYSAKGSLKVTSEKDGDNKVSGVFEFSIDANIAGESLDLSGKLDYAVEVGADIADYNTKNAKDTDDMTEEDAKKLQDALTELEDTEIFKFISELEDLDLDNLFGSSNINENQIQVNKCDVAICDYDTCEEKDGTEVCECEYFDYDNSKYETIMCEQ
ncbi:MAG: hypothetical protein ACI31M_01285 [Bacilli bacterium]